MSNHLYILRSEIKETYYIGVSDDPKRRLEYHNLEKKGYTNRNRPWKLVLTISFSSKESAVLAEQKVKSWKSKEMIRLLIDGVIDIENYLN